MLDNKTTDVLWNGLPRIIGTPRGSLVANHESVFRPGLTSALGKIKINSESIRRELRDFVDLKSWGVSHDPFRLDPRFITGDDCQDRRTR
jgi:hypothetical protein